jgi:linoleoyl-CoA desaturase
MYSFATMAKVVFQSADQSFFTGIKKEVDAYFKDNNLSKTGGWAIYSKAIILLSLAVVLYWAVIWANLPTWLALIGCSLLGFTFASIGFNVMHDANHGAFSNSSKLNDIMGLTLNALGGNAYIWKQKHNIIHHTYTNVDGVDDDIAKSPLMRQSPTQVWKPAHKFQHFYVVLIYMITSLAWVLIMDFQKYFSHKIYRTDRWEMSMKEEIIFWGGKLLYLIAYVIIPIYVVGFTPWLMGFLIMHVSLGFTLAIVFQLAHVVENIHFEEAYDDAIIEEAWAKHQVKTTANFAPKSRLINWYVGGLNFQIEHHLFPKISHVHYPAISGIIKKYCAQHNVPYIQFNTMAQAVGSHFRMMKHLGKAA